ncbi:potassium channel family protein [Methylobacterium planeticum]|uniref:Two pore domain potassium channel family protein n=1 Tax=Methylobacterium planeticum TaxID=2615211 RepID=A0A6N6MM28_9HYPH|nr:potassium channel family protein [Methylobacterium planeticum]KAB1072338.1 two pore domain potassium channel family protein [Methylobacterium planeticum]
MLTQLMVGAGASVCGITIHSFMMAAVLRVARSHAVRPGYSSMSLAWIMSSAVCVLMAAHTLEVTIWAAIYKAVGIAPVGADLFYFAFVNYTTLGYGDLIPVARWRLLGPVAAMNGILLFGWSTAVIFEILRRTLMRMDEVVR